MSDPTEFDEQEIHMLMEAMDKEIQRVQKWAYSKTRKLNDRETKAILLSYRSVYAKLARMLDNDRTAALSGRIHNLLKEMMNNET